ncbi:hypothetical protein N9W17_01175 [Jannaschia sp.]|nr:hypothetical protein [Jannaschia sp.]
MIGFRIPVLLSLGALGLTACAPPPMTPDRAEEACRAEIARASGVRPNIGIGIGRGGPRVRGGITFDGSVLAGGTPEERLARCIERRVAGGAPPPTVGVSVGGRL